jgi:hypothetical protein
MGSLGRGRVCLRAPIPSPPMLEQGVGAAGSWPSSPPRQGATASATSGKRRHGCFKEAAGLLQRAPAAATSGLHACYIRSPLLLTEAATVATGGCRCCYRWIPLLLKRSPQLLPKAAAAATSELRRCCKRSSRLLYLAGTAGMEAVAAVAKRYCKRSHTGARLVGETAAMTVEFCYILNFFCYICYIILLQLYNVIATRCLRRASPAKSGLLH